MKYTKEVLTEAVQNSISVAGVLRYLGLKQAGGTHSHIARRIREFKIDTTHFLGRRANSGQRHKGGPRKRHAKDIFILRTSGHRCKTKLLIRALLEDEIPHCCNECGLEQTWNCKKLTLQVDHINGNWFDDRKENLRFLCPNCHSQTSNFSRPKGG